MKREKVNNWVSRDSGGGATNKEGHEWTGQVEKEGVATFFNYIDRKGREYQTKEEPVYRIDWSKTCQVTNNGIMPIAG